MPPHRIDHRHEVICKEPVDQAAERRRALRKNLRQVVDFCLIGEAVAVPEVRVPPGQPGVRSGIEHNGAYSRIAADQPARAAENLQPLLEGMRGAARGGDMGDRTAGPAEQDVRRVEIAELHQARIDIAIELGMGAVGQPPDHPDQLVEVVYDHVGDDATLMRHGRGAGELRVAAHLQDMLDIADLAHGYPALHLAAVGVEAAVKAENHRQAGRGDPLDRRRDRGAIESDRFLAEHRQAEVACPQDVVDMGRRGRGDHQRIGPGSLHCGAELGETRHAMLRRQLSASSRIDDGDKVEPAVAGDRQRMHPADTPAPDYGNPICGHFPPPLAIDRGRCMR